jgi:steroid 5-alpha reductase family enzyme
MHDETTFWRGAAWVTLSYLIALVVGILTGHLVGVEDPIQVALVADLAATLVIFVFSVIFRNSSFYDAYWSVVPPAIVTYWILWEAQGGDPLRQALVLSVVVAWGYRLTRNWLYGWTGLDHEDWRYVDLRKKTGVFWQFVNMAGIHYFPTLIVFLGLLPAWYAVSSTTPSHLGDWIAAGIGFSATIIEAVSDHQMHAWRRGKHPPGAVMNKGLWRYSRHPNYFGEILFWVSLWLFAMAADPANLWTAAGWVAMAVMFRFISIPMMEQRQLARRPAYRVYIDRTSMVIPWMTRPGPAVPEFIPEPPRPSSADVASSEDPPTEETGFDEASVDLPSVTTPAESLFGEE